MISHDFQFFAPRRLDEALKLLTEHRSDVRALGGGMTLVPIMTLGLAQPAVVVSLNHIDELSYIRETTGALQIGGTTRHAMIQRDPLVEKYCPLLAKAASFIGDTQVRHRGTIGGSLAHADPAADYPPVMLASHARIRVASAAGERVIAAPDFFIGLLETALEPGEIIVEVVIPMISQGAGWSYQRLHRIEGSFSIVNAAAVIELGFRSAQLALGGVADSALLLDLSSLVKRGADDAALDAVGELAYGAAENAPSDLGGDTSYRRAMARVFARRTVKAAAESMKPS